MIDTSCGGARNVNTTQYVEGGTRRSKRSRGSVAPSMLVRANIYLPRSYVTDHLVSVTRRETFTHELDAMTTHGHLLAALVKARVGLSWARLTTSLGMAWSIELQISFVTATGPVIGR